MSSIPFHRLPFLLFEFIVQQMELPELLILSSMSKRFKPLIRYSKLQTSMMQVEVLGICTIKVQVGQETYAFKYNRFTGESLDPNFKNLSLNVFVLNLMVIFHLKQITSFRVGRLGVPAFVRQHLNGLTWRELDIFVTYPASTNLYIDLIPTEQLISKCLSNPEVKISKEVLMTPLKVVSFDEADELKLDDLLTMNCENASFTKTKLSDNDLNLFINHWISGGLSRIRRVRIHTLGGSFRGRDVLNGVIGQRTLERTLEVRDNIFKETAVLTVRNGFDVKREDGKTATILLISCYLGYRLEMFVW